MNLSPLAYHIRLNGLLLVKFKNIAINNLLQLIILPFKSLTGQPLSNLKTKMIPISVKSNSLKQEISNKI